MPESFVIETALCSAILSSILPVSTDIIPLFIFIPQRLDPLLDRQQWWKGGALRAHAQ